MAVKTGLRRRGIASAMLAAAEQQAALWDQQLMALHVYVDNSAAQRLYTSYGLRSVCQDPAWTAWVGGRIRTLMVKPLQP